MTPCAAPRISGGRPVAEGPAPRLRTAASADTPSEAEMGERRDRIERKLRERLEAEHVELLDESAKHAGHPGAAGGGGHFKALVVSERFQGLSRLAAQRAVYAALADEMEGAIHALAITALTPERWRARGG